MKETKPSKLLSQAKCELTASSAPLSYSQAAVPNELNETTNNRIQELEHGGAYPSSVEGHLGGLGREWVPGLRSLSDRGQQ